MTDILPQTQNEEAFDLLGQSENIAVSHVAESEITSATDPRQNTSPQASKKRNIVQQVDLNSTRELSDPITNELRSPQTVQTSPRKVDNQDEDGFFDDLHAQIVKNMRESRIQEVQNRPAPGPYISDNLFTSTYFYPASSSMAYSSLRGAITPTANIANSVYLTKSASSGVYAKPVSLQTSPKGFGDLLVKINQTLRTSNPTKYADDVKVSYRVPTEYTSNLSVRQNTGGYDKNKVDQILAKIVRTSHNNKPNPASILRTSTGPTYEKVLPKNISQQEVRFSVQSEERESVKKAQAPKKKHRTVTRNLQNDEDSMYVERIPERIEEEIVEERVRREPVVVHHEEKPKKLTKRQEIINEKKSLRSSSQHMKSTGEMRQSRLTLNNDKPAEKRFGTEFILSPKKISATHYVSFGSQKGRGSSTMARKVFNDNAN